MNTRGAQHKKRGMDISFTVFVCCPGIHFGVLAGLLLGGIMFVASATGSEPTKHRDILRLARTTDPQTLDPTLMISVEDFLLWPLLHLPLLDIIGGTNLVPCAAEKWNISADQRLFTIHLRPGMRFSSGREVNASDYVYTLERVLNPATGSWFSSYLGDIRGAQAFVARQSNHVAGIKALSSSTFYVELNHPDPAFAYLFTSITGMPHEDVEHHQRDYAVRPVCTGPFMVESWVRGAHLKLNRNPYFQGPESVHFEGINVIIGGDETTHLMMFERGELDIANITGAGIPRASFRRLANHPRWRGLIERIPLFSTQCVILNTETPPLNHILVRRAINHAIDRDRRMQVALGFNTHAEGVLPPRMPGYNPALRGYRYDPELARQLLRETGLTLPLCTQLWHDTSEGMRTLAQGIQWDLKRVGIEVELNMVAGNELLTASSIRGKVPMTLTGWSAVLPDPKDMLGSHFDGQDLTNISAANQSFYYNPEVTRILTNAAVEGSGPLRLKLYQRAEEMIVSDAPWVFLAHQNTLALRQQWLKGPLLDPLWWYRFDRIWIER